MKHDRPEEQERGVIHESFAIGIKTAFATAVLGLALAGPMVGVTPPAQVAEAAAATGSRTIGDISASGLLFKVSLAAYHASLRPYNYCRYSV